MDDRMNLLTSISGVKITNIEEWEYFRRPEIMMLLENFVYGVRPYEIPQKLEFKEKRYEKSYFGKKRCPSGDAFNPCFFGRIGAGIFPAFPSGAGISNENEKRRIKNGCTWLR